MNTDRGQAGVGGLILLMLVLLGVAGAVVGYTVFDGGVIGVAAGIGGFIAFPAALMLFQGIAIGLFEYVFPAIFGFADERLQAAASSLLPERLASGLYNIVSLLAVAVGLICVICTAPITMGNVLVATAVTNMFGGLAGGATYVVMTVVGFTGMAMAGI